MSDVSICVFCGYPVIFRFKPPQMYHLPSGWHCWWQPSRKTVARLARCAHRRIPTTTPIKVRRPLVEKAKERYEAYLATDDLKPPLRFLRRELLAHRGDVVRDFLGFLADPEMESELRDDLVSKLVATAEWERLTEELAAAA